MNVTCSGKHEKLVEANACQRAVEVTRRLLLYPRWCQRGAQGAPAYKRPCFPSSLSGGDGETCPCWFRLRFPSGSAVLAASPERFLETPTLLHADLNKNDSAPQIHQL